MADTRKPRIADKGDARPGKFAPDAGRHLAKELKPDQIFHGSKPGRRLNKTDKLARVLKGY